VWCGLDRATIGARLGEALEAATREGGRPTALFSLFLPGAVAMLAETRRRGWRAPGEVSIASFDDADWLAAAAPPVSAVAQPARAIGASAFGLLLDRIRGHDGPPRAARAPCVFHDRASLGPPPAGG
jgi:LacI family transcriptional regulator